MLETRRLRLRRLRPADEPELIALDSDPEVMRFLTGGSPTSREVIRDEIMPAWFGYYRRYPGFGFWAAVER